MGKTATSPTVKKAMKLLDKQLDRASDLIERDQYADVLGMLEPALAEAPAIGGEFDDTLSRAFNIHGLALKGVGRLDEARAAFERASEAGDTYAELNILDLLDDARRSADVIAHALKVRDDRYLDDYARVWVARYLAGAYLDTGETAKAEEELRDIVTRYGVKDADLVTKARAGLEAYIAAGRPGAAAARDMLAWVQPKRYDVTPDEAKANKAWWKRVPEAMRSKLLEKVGKSDEEDDPSDEAIARALDADSLRLDEDDGTFDNLDLLTRLTNLSRLSFYGDPDTLEPLRALPRLESLTINNVVIKNFAWPSRADRDLVKAAASSNKKGIEKALAAGASIMARDLEDGDTALHKAASEHDIALCTWLIARGADPWAGNWGESDAFYFFSDDERVVLEEAAAAAGIRHPDEDPYRVFSIAPMPKAARFSPTGDLDAEPDTGKPLASSWPDGVRYAMQPPKKEDKLYDVLPAHSGAVPLVCETVATLLRDQPGVELLPVTLVDHANKPRPERYFALNALAIDCLDVTRCHPQWNHIDPDSMSEVAVHAIDPSKVGSAAMFRARGLRGGPIFVTRELASKLAECSGAQISYAKR